MNSRPASQGTPATSVAGVPWRPLLTGTSRDRALRVIDGLAARQRADSGALRGASLSAGAAGAAVAWAVLARARDDDSAAERASERLDEAVDLLGSEPLTAGLYAGFTGVAWATEIVDGLLGPPDEDRNEAIDDAVIALLDRQPREDVPYDLIQGLVGMGVYALGRWPRPAAAECLNGVVQHLAARARPDDDGVFWWTPPTLLFGPKREMFPAGGVDLGVAHGIAGVVPLLARAHALGVRPESAAPLLDGAVAWLSEHLLDAPWGRTVPAF